MDRNAMIEMAYVTEAVPISELAARFKITTRQFRRVLRERGVDRSRRFRVTRECPECGVPVVVQRRVASRSSRSFCGRECYGRYLSNPEYVRDVMGMRRSRAVARVFYPRLTSANVVHHVDGDCSNAAPGNLMVFASHSDHMKHHHGAPVKPLWAGDKRLMG